MKFEKIEKDGQTWSVSNTKNTKHALYTQFIRYTLKMAWIILMHFSAKSWSYAIGIMIPLLHYFFNKMNYQQLVISFSHVLLRHLTINALNSNNWWNVSFIDT